MALACSCIRCAVCELLLTARAPVCMTERVGLVDAGAASAFEKVERGPHEVAQEHPLPLPPLLVLACGLLCLCIGAGAVLHF